jgi:BRCT domain type II-containing protein
MKRTRKRAKRRKAKPKATSPSSTRATTPGITTQNRSKRVLSPEALERVGKVLPGIITAVAKLIDAISKLH